jgi:hypothetical protein
MRDSRVSLQRTQRGQTACNRVRSSLTRQAGMGEGSKLTIHRGFQRLISDQLRFLGLTMTKYLNGRQSSGELSRTV